MNKKQNKPENNTTNEATQPAPLPTRVRPTCEQVIQAQNAHLSSLCAKKANSLPCRCSNCNTDDRFPVINSPSDAPLLNTAYDETNGGFLATGQDSHWEAGLGAPSGPGSVPSSGPNSWMPAFVFHNPAWVTSPFGNANWISFFKDSLQGQKDVDAYFRYRFNLSSSVDPATFALTMDFYADNRVWEIYVNGCPQSTKPNGSGILPQFPNLGQDVYEAPGYQMGNAVQIKLDNCWQRCENEIIVHVMSHPGALGFLAQNAVAVTPDETGCDCHCDCVAVELPDIHPCISVKWGDSPCDCLETDDVEVLCVTVCNCYSNVTFTNLTIGQIQVTDLAGKPVANLPDGTPSVQVIPSGPICFGDIGPCIDSNHPSCVSRELVLHTRGALGGKYRLTFNAICFDVCHHFQSQCLFTMKLCQD